MNASFLLLAKKKNNEIFFLLYRSWPMLSSFSNFRATLCEPRNFSFSSSVKSKYLFQMHVELSAKLTLASIKRVFLFSYRNSRISRLLSTIFLLDWLNLCFRSDTSVPNLRCFFRERTSFGLISINICSVHNSDSKPLNSGLIALCNKRIIGFKSNGIRNSNNVYHWKVSTYSAILA